MMNARLLSLSAAATTALLSLPAMAQESIGKPTPGAMGFQPAVTNQAAELQQYDYFLHILSGAIVLFVTVLLLICIFKFSAKKNPTPARFTHNAALEVAWTGIPILILIVMGVWSVPILYNQMTIPKADVVIKATGNQWYWSYEYPEEEIEFDSIMLAREELEEYGYAQDEFLLATDTAVVVPVNSNVHLLVAAADVIHAWTVPAFGVKTDAMPGRLNEIWFNANTVGTYFGQCSELCGKDHAYMPIVVKVLSQEDYDAWVEETKIAQGILPAAVQTAAVVD
ncbi:MAG: cytochrome c oxidase subunit II [Pikeienuella sp.]